MHTSQTRMVSKLTSLLAEAASKAAVMGDWAPSANSATSAHTSLMPSTCA